MDLPVKEIENVVKATIQGPTNRNIKKIIIDSRQIISPEDTLFVAIRGERHDGHKYISELYKKGIRIFIVDHPIDGISDSNDITFIIVNDTLLAFQKIASYYRQKFKIPVIGITGSNGKTIIKEWLYHILNEKYVITRSPKSYNSQTGVPLSVLQLDSSTQLGIFEAGISLKGEMDRLQDIIRPTIGIFANIGSAHQENFSSLEEKITEKLKLFTSCNTLIYCSDHQLIHETIQKSGLSSHCMLLTWSMNQPATLRITRLISGEKFTRIEGEYKSQSISIEIPFTDRASIENAIHCWLTVLHLGMRPDEVATKMLTITYISMRMEQIPGINGCTIINDSYNSDLPSLSIALDFLMQQQYSRKTVILSDILQTGEPESILYQKVSALIKEKKVDKIIGIGRGLYQHAGLFDCEKEFYLSTEDFISQFQHSKFVNEAILIKGARYFAFEKISALLEKRIHRTTLEINMNALIHNLNHYRSKLKPSTKIVIMVKAFSYGSGGYEIANLLEFHKVDYLAVAYVDEGIALRKANISLPIMVMSPEEGSIQHLIEYQLEPEVYSFDILKQFIEEAKNQQLKSLPVHIKIDTGMHRLGFLGDDLPELSKILKNETSVKVKSVFSHLAASDEPAQDDFTREQFQKFIKACETIKENIGYAFDRHILNSAGIERFSEYQMEMVRLGIGLYGISSFDQSFLQNVSTLKTRIIQIKRIKKGETIGYGRKGKTFRDTNIAVLPIGYADGYTRRLSNIGRVWINGAYANIIGNICMDMCMIDVTNIPVKVGDEVELFGNHIPVQEIADKTGTITYEILTGISDRVKRIYVNE
jgi:alanine racemase